MPDLTPMTRQEKFLNGDTDLEPITRREHFYAGRESELPEGHQEPETREEWFIKEYRGGGGGDITVESLSVTSNGTYTAPSGKAYSPVNVNVPLPQNAYLLKSVNTPTPIASFNDGEEMVMPSLKVAIEPQQDLHGYDAPWVGGAGKNKLKNKLTTQTYNGVTATVKDDGTVVLTGTATQATNFFLNTDLNLQGDYTINGCPSGGSDSTYYINAYVNGAWGRKDNGNGVTVNNATITNIAITVANGYAFPSGGLTFKPMIRLASDSDSTFAPYSNICPISGWSAVDVTKCGKNHFDNTTITVKKFLTSDGRIETSANWSISDYIGVKGGTAYILSGVTNAGTAAYHCFYDKDKNFISSVISTTQNFTTPSNAVYVRLSMRTETPDAVQLELGNTATEYHAYNGQTYTIDLDGTRYGGELDVVNGIVTPAPYYASYNGEALTGEWISDRDKYEVGATPTIGAQVVNIGASGTPVSIQSTAVKSIRGQNNVYANTGNIKDAEYFSKEV